MAACGFPRIVGVQPEAVATEAKIVPAPNFIVQIDVCYSLLVLITRHDKLTALR